VYQLGPTKSFWVLKNRIVTKYKARKLKQLAQAKKANHTWEMIVQKHNLNKSFPVFFERLKQNCDNFFPEKVLESLQQDNEIEKKADLFVQNIFDLLGSGPTQFTKIDWHVDFRLKKQNPQADCQFSKNRFYQDPELGESKTERFAKDIKVPWELSRCYHFSALGQAYKKTKNKKYFDAFYAQINDWIEKNPYVLGPNWMCPMEVAIRAINWIVGLYYFKVSPVCHNLDGVGSLSQDRACAQKYENGYRRVIESLYDHFIYLQNNWEVYDSRTSNHYLSDLVGYFFLCFFFQNLSGVEEKKQWCYQEILREFDKQVFQQGTDYEGSTAYHGLVAELFYLFYELCKKNNVLLPELFEKKLTKMFEFINWCTPHEGEEFCTTRESVLEAQQCLVKIGDDDSGKILLSGITQQLIKKFVPVDLMGKKDFLTFGLSVIKTKKWHITLRHHAYGHGQPSGHFHNDVASVTLAVGGVPILVDPGSFVYTPSSAWRNKFRSVQAHNTFYLKGYEPVSFEDFLFTLNLPERKAVSYSEGGVLQTEHNLYRQFGLSVRRTVFFDQEKKNLKISDVWLGQKKDAGQIGCHNFTLAPDIEPVQQEGVWIFLHRNKPILCMSTKALNFYVMSSWFCSSYGKKVKTRSFKSMYPVDVGKKMEFLFFKP